MPIIPVLGKQRQAELEGSLATQFSLLGRPWTNERLGLSKNNTEDSQGMTLAVHLSSTHMYTHAHLRTNPNIF